MIKEQIDLIKKGEIDLLIIEQKAVYGTLENLVRGLYRKPEKAETEITKLKAERDNLQMTIRSLKMRGEDG